MKRPITWWAMVATATLGLGLSGCGKSAVKEEAKVADSEESAPPEDSAPPAPAANAPAAAPKPAPAAAAAPPAGKSDAEELLAMGSGPAAPAANAPQSGPPGGGGSNQTQMPANYPRPGNQGPGGPPGGGGSNQTQMPANYPRPGNQGPGSEPGGGGSNQTQMPANYPRPGNQGPGGPPGGGGGNQRRLPQPGTGGPPGPGGPSGEPGMAGGPNGEPGMAGGPGQPGQPGGRMMPGMSPGGGGADAAVNDFTNPTKAASSFLSAVQAKDAERLADAVALRARYEAGSEHKPVLSSVLDKTPAAEDLDKMARDFAGMKFMSLGARKGSGEQNVVVGKADQKQSTTRVLTVRKEKAGWKVQDYGGARVIKIPQMRNSGSGSGNGAGAGAVGGGGGGGAAPIY
jgi:hypothetical protein